MRHLIVKDSDIIESVGFDMASNNGHTRGTLEVVFKSSPDTIYSYAGVGTEEFAVLVSAESIGKMFHEMFRKTKYPFTKSDRLTLKK